jgi:hypothetical protein
MMHLLWRRTLAFVAAVAAIVAVAFALIYRPHKPGYVGPTPVAPITSPAPVQAWEPLVDHIKQVHYGRYMDGVTSGMKDAVAQITGGVDEAIDSPLVAGTAKTARQVAGEFGQVFADIGSQLRPRLQ